MKSNGLIKRVGLDLHNYTHRSQNTLFIIKYFNICSFNWRFDIETCQMGIWQKPLRCEAGSGFMTNHWSRGNGHHFSHFPGPKMWLGAAKTWTEKCENERMPEQQSNRCGKRKENGVELMRWRPDRPRRPAYLPLQHQLFGEQHGLVAERFRHLHSSGHIPGTAWTFDTCGRQAGGRGVSVAAANHGGGGGGS